MKFKKFFHREIYLPIIHLYDLLHDFKRGIRTTENYEISDLGFSDEIGNKYQPLGYNRLIEVIKYAANINPNSCFIDAGCGKGRPLFVALENGFNNVLGVEISKKLFNICKRNLSKYDGNYNLICSDIDNFQFPKGSLTIFLFNPFNGKKLNKLKNQIMKKKNNGLIIYFNPKYDYVFSNMKIIRKFQWYNFGLFKEECKIYEIL
ncbi:MAG: class I SAM-dependent methyltransferase [Paracoccaceae bacterium]|tara:strand:- start:209 stop:823 length:615 start_codon:yes stop_codon:yes gene_type:complete